MGDVLSNCKETAPGPVPVTWLGNGIYVSAGFLLPLKNKQSAKPCVLKFKK